ncbi:MAG TPA: hypothetical protein GYA07_05435 [Verrucomicrobia bacterium]|nr:hypothetical protein [Verrucomicrobiota bacterium]HOB31282.1 hypothetical protein [Verrucomicrobiota bacterium]HOP96928.1 hypothetical protein [Verrucomicrobiota bacterium]HPU55635.1 hypothetical protein [Verrucomicrobiota bacterium]
MFKKNFATAPAGIPPGPGALLLLAALAAGCASLPPLPPPALSAPQWTISSGQALWKSRPDAPEIAGDILVATTPGRSFVQFTKTPFTLVTAQTASNTWQLEIPAENRRYTRRGSPPAQVLWLQLPRAMSGQALPENVRWNVAQSGWKLENTATGESIEGYFSNAPVGAGRP